MPTLFDTCSRQNNLKLAYLVDKKAEFLNLNICYMLCVLLWIKYWLMWFESLLVSVLFKFKNVPIVPEFVLYYYYKYNFYW